MKRNLFFLSLLFFYFPAIGQQFFFKQYRVENGLPSDIVKACTQGPLGYFWIATDDGLVKYDGIKFTTYREAMHSNFAKGFITTRSGRLLAYGDLDIIEIKNLGDTVIFNSVYPVGRNANDSTLSYPKLVFEDTQHKLWVSESQSVVKLQGKSFKRYSFDLTNRSPQFLRSFAFFEDQKQNLYTTSFQGNVFRLNSESDEFESYPEKLPKEIEFASVLDGKLIVGSSGGLFECEFLPEGGFGKPHLKFDIRNVSWVTHFQESIYVVATRDLHHYIADFRNNTYFDVGKEITNVNHVYVSREKDVWLSGNDGLILVKEKLIQEASDHVNTFVEAITEDPASHKIYYATSTTLFSYNTETKKNTTELTIPNGYFQSILLTKEGMWIANAFNVYLYKDNKIIKQFDFSKDRRFIADIVKDSKGNIWLAESGNPDVYMVDPALTLKQVKIPLGNEGTINMACEGPDGVYIASTGKSSYLFYKAHNESEFRNISKPVRFTTHRDFDVTDLALTKDVVWLASSEGLLRMDDEKIERIDLGPTYTPLPLKSIKVYSPDELLISNAYGMILYNIKTGTYDLFNESSGLLSNTITSRGLFISKNGSVWIGTSMGLCFTRKSLRDLQKTPTPRFTEILINGKEVRIDSTKELEHSSFISIKVSSITFPEKEITIQYRLSPDTLWHTNMGSEIIFSSLPAGNYKLEVRSKKNGPYSWSDTAALTFKMAKPFWQQAWFLFLSFVSVLVLVFVTVLWANSRNKLRNRELQLLIAERTNELKEINEELELRNAELDRFVYSASHDLSAPLKSLLGLISVAKMEKSVERMDNYLDLMKRSILKLESFIKDIISYSRNTRLEVKNESVDFNALIQSIWDDLLFAPDADKIEFETVNELKSELKSDETRLRIIFNNLLSNAVKFRQDGKDSYIKVFAAEHPDHFEFTVKDNGIGIPMEFKEKIFDMFFRANERVQGSGLGLYILRETLSRLKGTITVESTLGEGTTFVIHLPK